ncbi:MAG: type II secretion system minor pseudopilin GspH [Pseudomonadota bacterium]
MQHAMRPERGFTLLEIMAVMLIIAIIAAIATPNLFAARSRGTDLEREAAALAARIRVAQDDAMLYGHEYGVVFTAEGYRFVRWDAKGNRFRSIVAGAGWTRRQLENGVRVSAVANSGDPILVLPEPTEEDAGDDTAAGENTSAEDESAWQPSVFVLSSGEVTPFTAVFSAEGAERPLELRIDPLGNRLYAADEKPVPQSAGGGVPDAG